MVVNVAHRGASGDYPENTLLAFEKALEIGVDEIELDLHSTRDGHLVVMHDATVDRTTDGTGAIGDLTLAEIKALDAGSAFDGRFRGERVPTWEEALDLVQGRVGLNVHLKEGGDPDGAYERRVAEAMDRFGMVERSVVTCRDESVGIFAGIDPRIECRIFRGSRTPEEYIRKSAEMGLRTMQPGRDITTAGVRPEGARGGTHRARLLRGYPPRHAGLHRHRRRRDPDELPGPAEGSSRRDRVTDPISPAASPRRQRPARCVPLCSSYTRCISSIVSNQPTMWAAPKESTRLHRPPVNLLDHDDDAAGPLAAPRLVDHRRLEGHPRQPGTLLARPSVPRMVCTNEVLRRPVQVPAVAELQVRRKGGEELAGRDAHSPGTAEIAEVDLAERVPSLVADAARCVVAEEHLRRVVDAVDPVHEDEEPLAPGEDDPLRPARPGLAAGGGVLEPAGGRDGDELRPRGSPPAGRASSCGTAAAPRSCACGGCCRGTCGCSSAAPGRSRSRTTSTGRPRVRPGRSPGRRTPRRCPLP